MVGKSSSRHGGLSARHMNRRGSGRAVDQARPAAVHRSAPPPAPPMLTAPCATRFGIVQRLEFYSAEELPASCGVLRGSSASTATRRRRRDRTRRRTRHARRIATAAARVATRQVAATAPSTLPSPARRWHAEVDRQGSTNSTGACSAHHRRLRRRRSAWNRWPAALSEERGTSKT